ncbi:hypothetical protein DNTS_014895 [Danionella cerebrum]|uniref:C2H2-type domain-containing protein n=1 Tax=Danionella cerebrum TaxID=2873325 RepID=A0A553RB19_9TELE|nr:hypothetical protein DNTS_014895 [Danionella translucida]
MGEGKDTMDSAKTTRISLSFPLSTGLTTFSAQKHSSSSQSNSSSDFQKREGSDDKVWMGEAFRNIQQSTTSEKADHLPCSSSTFPIDLTTPVNKNCKSSLSFSVDANGSQYPTSSLKMCNKMDVSKESTGGCLNNGYKEHSTTETAHILFNLSARAYQDQCEKDPESSKGKKRKANSLHVELSLPLSSINPHSSTVTTPPPSPSSVTLTSSPLTLPKASFHDSFRPEPKPELLCGVCHRLFSTASSLTVHMRLHRGGRILSCRHCGKAFIHNKRLQSHEATCRHRLPAFPVPPKKEPLEEGEVEGEIADEATELEQLGQETKQGQPIKTDIHSGLTGTSTSMDMLGEEDHFVKVVDGHIIYFCSVCERSYMTLSSLKRHSNVHSWRRKYPCHYCDKVFALAEYRTKHEVWHTGERRYQCIFCWEAFPTYYNLKTHQKALHGINPGLISSEKTANGGYKQKVNALKLYRLLPMRSLKRPYKTYSNQLADGLLTSDSAVSLPLSINGSLPQPLDTENLESFLKDLQSSDIKTETEGFPIKPGVEHDRKLAPIVVGEETTEIKGSDLWRLDINDKKGQISQVPEGVVSSVIAFAHSKPSVIMHSTAISSSVIVHRNKTDSDEGKRRTEKHSKPKADQKHLKKHNHRDHTDACRGNDISNITQQTEKLKKKGRKFLNKKETSKKIPITLGSEVKGSGPLCQITVRIGEEAIVKRSISETDLRRDKSPLWSKSKKNNLSRENQREPKLTHYNQQKQSNSNQGGKKETKWKNTKHRAKVRKYFFRQEVREDRKEHDAEDNLWRPYYSYKPKRKALHMQGTKGWKHKMHFKRSLRSMRIADRLIKNENKEAVGEDVHEEEEIMQKEKKEQTEDSATIHRESDSPKTEVKEMLQTFTASFKTTEDKEKATNEKLSSNPPLPSNQTIPNPHHHATSSTINQRWSQDQVSECGTCGRWFSSTRKRDKHELTHLFEFVCMLCRATFSSQSKFEEHQRSQHPKNKPQSTASLFSCQLSRNELEIKSNENGENNQSTEKGSPVRFGRRPLIRYACSKCDKVCKTSSALNCHLKRHEVSSSTEIEASQENQKVTSKESTAKYGFDTNNEQVQPVSVIYYSKPECQLTENKLGAKTDEHQRNCKSPKIFDNSPLCPQFHQNIPSPTLERFKVISPKPPSVLVMNGTECLDYRTPEKKNVDAFNQQKKSQSDTQIQISYKTNIRKDTSPCGPISQKRGSGFVIREDESNPDEDFKDLQDVQDLRMFSQTNSQAQDLSMPTILAKQRELDRQNEYLSSNSKKQSCNEEVSLRLPKEEPLSPTPSPTYSVIHATPKGQSQHYSNSQSHAPEPLDLQLRPQLEQSQSHRGRYNSEKQELRFPARISDSHAMLHPQAPTSKPDSVDSITPREHHRGLSYSVQELPLPVVIPGGYCSGKKQEEEILMSYPAGPLPFPSLGKMVPHTDSAKLPFYPDPYHLLYGPQLLPYPYNFAGLPMTLNMMASGDKEPLPFLPFFNYAAAAAPLTATMPHHFMVNPSIYNSGSSSSTKQDHP